MNTTKCTKCLKTKPLDMFYFRKPLNKYESRCKECIKEEKRLWEEKNKEKHKEQSRLWKQNHKEEVKLYNKEYKLKNKERIDRQNQEYREKNREKMYEASRLSYQKYKKERNKKNYLYHKHRQETDYVCKLKKQVRIMVNNSFKRNGHTKNEKTEKIIGCNIDFFIEYLLQTYKNNYGIEWDKKEPIDIDHKTPLATAKTEEDIIKLCHYTNLQLLKHSDNLFKGSKLNWELNRGD